MYSAWGVQVWLLQGDLPDALGTIIYPEILEVLAKSSLASYWMGFAWEAVPAGSSSAQKL